MLLSLSAAGGTLATAIIAGVIAVIFLAIIIRGIYNKKHHKSGCGCGCEGCANSCACHSHTAEKR